MELLNGVTVEDLQALYFDKDAIRLAPQKVYRVGGTAKRVYYTIDPDGEPYFYSSVTEFLSRSLPTPHHLIKWIADMGYEEANEYRDIRAYYGTFMHIEWSSLLIHRMYDLDSLRDRLLAYIDENKLPASFITHEEEMKRDMLSFANWVLESNVKPLAIEIMLASKAMGLGGAIDLPCEFDVPAKVDSGEVYKSGPRKGEVKLVNGTERVRAIIDFKSGRKGFNDQHALQLEVYRLIWNENFPDLEIQRIFNWSPKEWKGSEPTYHLTEQTENPVLTKLPYLLAMEKASKNSLDRTIMVSEGVIDLDRTKSLGENMYAVYLSDMIKKGHED